MKKLFYTLPVIFSFIFSSCGVGGNADSGVSVLLEVKNVVPAYLEIDLIKKIDNDNNGTCDDFTIPTGDQISVTFKSVIPENSKVQPSDIIITSYKVYFYPKNKDINVPPQSFGASCLIPAGATQTCTFPVFLSSKKLDFYKNNWQDEFDIVIEFRGKEVIYDKSLTINAQVTSLISDIIQEGEPNCSMPK